ncbi:hypothetical protein Clacol_006079 [Clathrus columnatus]|uniref:tripeptidyl-peptidase II n=1 Tax=Clathrus columnatus TaxID=1419009 RepID=A0AAV5AH77_9AGAM|nr:hypothetical protein Clacol_006079 [Clathrus columnatus]
MFSPRSLVRLSLLSSLGLGLLLLFSLIYSSPLQEQLVVHLQLDQVPDSYVQVGKPNSQDVIKFTIGLVSPNMSYLETKLYEISNPNHTDYGKYFSKEEVEDIVRPQANVTTALTTWLSNHKLIAKNSTGANHRFNVEMTVSQAEKVFNTTINLYNHTASNQTIMRATQYSVPKRLSQDISFVSPISRYQIPANIGVPQTNDETVILALGQQNLQGKDIAVFMKDFRQDIPLSQLRLEVVSVEGGDDVQGVPGDNGEVTLDVSMVAGVTPGSRMTVLEVGDHDIFDAFDALLGQDTAMTVASFSYGSDEPGDPGTISELQFLCQEIMQMTSRGITFVTSAGDNGVAGGDLSEPSCTTFRMNWPASCPWALSVGATQINPDNSESAASLTTGGFSNIFPMPPYQNELVGNYLKQIGSLNAGLFSPQGRAVPDVAAFGQNIAIIDGGPSTIGGTSASAPIVAGILAAINDHRRANGKGPMGFVNQILYSNPDAFTDITQGSNPGCNTNGFQAIHGWDAVTGLGSPNFQKLLNILS